MAVQRTWATGNGNLATTYESQQFIRKMIKRQSTVFMDGKFLLILSLDF